MTLVHVLDALTAPRFPAQIPTFHVVASWQNSTDMLARIRLRLSIEDSAGDTASVLSDEEVAFSGRTSHRSVCIVQSLTVLRPGPYRVVASWQLPDGQAWQEAGQHPFTVLASVRSAGSAQA